MNMRLLALCLVACSLFQAAAQAPAKSEPEVVSHEAPATFSSRVNLVSVPVVIRDHEGHAVGRLRQEDFQLFDKGKAQIITKFTIQTSTSAPVATPASTPSASSAAAPAETAPKPELPDRYVAYFFDDIHMQPGDLLDARKAAAHHLDTAFDSSTRAGVFTTSGRTTQGFTNDVAKLQDALNRIQPWTSINDKMECLQISYYIADYLINREVSLSPFGINTGSRLAVEMANEADACLHHPTNPSDATLRYLWTTAHNVLIYGQEETSSGLSVLRDLITKMSTLPGGRTIVLASPGFIMGAEHRTNEDGILESAIRASVIINSLDIRGVYSPLRTHGYDVESRGAPGVARQTADREEATESGNILAELAYGTGGTVHSDNDFEGGLKELAGRPEYIYVLGFSPDNLKFDGSYHGLKVKLKEPAKFDVVKFNIEARRGYWAPKRAVDPAEVAKEELKETLFSRDEIADIPLDLHAEFFKPGGAKAEISVVARLDAKALKFRKVEERNNDTLTVVTGLFDQNGNYISGIERVVEMRLRDHSLEVLESAGISVEQSFSVPSGRYIVRVVVKDSEGHTTAARNTGIEVP
jgi:VWFA-related protein